MNVGNNAPDVKCLLSLCTTEGYSLCCIVAAYIVSVLSVCFLFNTNFVCIILSKNIDLEDSGIIYFIKKKINYQSNVLTDNLILFLYLVYNTKRRAV